jgi:hypothetical protein
MHLKEAYSCISWINQSYSWSQLLITRDLFQKLLTALKVHPLFLEVVHTFGERVSPVEESYAACVTRLQPDTPLSHQCMYGEAQERIAEF